MPVQPLLYVKPLCQTNGGVLSINFYNCHSFFSCTSAIVCASSRASRDVSVVFTRDNTWIASRCRKIKENLIVSTCQSLIGLQIQKNDWQMFHHRKCKWITNPIGKDCICVQCCAIEYRSTAQEKQFAP
jgi:hypothetical protein